MSVPGAGLSSSCCVWLGRAGQAALLEAVAIPSFCLTYSGFSTQCPPVGLHLQAAAWGYFGLVFFKFVCGISCSAHTGQGMFSLQHWQE